MFSFYDKIRSFCVIPKLQFEELLLSRDGQKAKEGHNVVR
jgi:hypothetical protein